MLQGLNHITFAVKDVERSVSFYRDVLGCEVRATWSSGAYLTIGDCWLCLSLDPSSTPSEDYSHIAFSVDAELFVAFRESLTERGIEIWKQNTSEGDSVYFVDPDGHHLEAHVGSLESRLTDMRDRPYDDQELSPK